MKHGTSQIETVAAGVQHLCRELGPAEATDANGQPIPQDGTNGGLLSEVRQLLAENRGRGDQVGELQTSIEGLMAAVREGIQTAEARGQFRKWRQGSTSLLYSCPGSSCGDYDGAD